MRKYIIPTAAYFILYLLNTPYSYSATLILKNGRKIQAEQIIEEGDTYRCHISEGFSASFPKDNVAEVQFNNYPTVHTISQSQNPFTYDIWTSGIDLYQAFDIARSHNLPFCKKGIVSMKHGYHPKYAEPYAKTCRSFSYRSELLGRKCLIHLHFTPHSKLLYCIEIIWNTASEIKQFRNELEMILHEKYGPIQSNGFTLVSRLKKWTPNKNFKIKLEYFHVTTKLSYFDNEMILLKEKEKKALYTIKKNSYLNKDKNKF